jgi:hypothetical protein
MKITKQVEITLADNLEALILGGGYGRGEGAVVLSAGRELPYNDLDFTLIVKNKSKLQDGALKEISSTFGREIGIHVDFSRPLTLHDVENWPSWLMWFDLLNGHVVLSGPENILLNYAPPNLKRPLPAIEGTRLLLNRGAGLLWAMRVLRSYEESPDEDFVRRNYYKCALALGDALLIAHQCFTTRYSGRDILFQDLCGKETTVSELGLRSIYEKALRFKFRPDLVMDTPPEIRQFELLAEEWGKVLLHVERVRTGLDLRSLEEYCFWTGIRESEQHTGRALFRNILKNLQLGKFTWKYPRESLYRKLPVLLGVTTFQAENWKTESEEFLKIWDRFN